MTKLFTLSKTKKLICILFACAAIAVNNAYAQPQFRWLINGGSADAGPVALTERVRNMASDAHGNIYVTSSVYRNFISVAGATLPDGHDAMFTDILLTSLDCSGKHRWSKIIGGIPGEDAPLVKVSPQGRVYLGGYVSQNGVQPVDFDTDTTLAAGSFQSVFIAQYDTVGHLKWLRMLQSDTVTTWSFSRTKVIDMDVDTLGNVYAFCMFPPNSALSGSSLTIPAGSGEVAFYVLKYSPAGSLMSVSKMDMTMPFGSMTIINGMYMRRHPITGNYYINGGVTPYAPYNDTLYLGSNYQDTRLFLACYNPAGSLLWYKKSTYSAGLNNSMFQDGAYFDASGNVYIGGQGGHGDSFNGASFSNPLNPTISGVVPFVMKMNAAGAFSWVSSGYCEYGVTWQMAMNSNKIAIGGVYAGLMVWGSDSMRNNNLASGQDGWFAVLDKATGNIQHIDSLAGPSICDGVTSLHYRNSDLFIGGYFQSRIVAGSDTAFTNGGSSDFFVTKYGDTCGAIVIAGGSVPLSEHQVVKVYPTFVQDQLIVDNAQKGMQLQCIDLVGRVVLSQVLDQGRNVISAGRLQPGMYLVKLQAAAGATTCERIIKQ